MEKEYPNRIIVGFGTYPQDLMNRILVEKIPCHW